MLVYNIERRQGTSKKTGNTYDATVISGLCRRLNGGVSSVDIWVNNDNPGLVGLTPGVQIRVAQDGGISYIQRLPDDATEELELLLAKIL